MKRFIDFIAELYSNDLKKGFKPSTGSYLGSSPPAYITKRIGTLDSGDHLHHYSTESNHGTTHHYYVVGAKSGKTNIQLSTFQPSDEKAEHIGLLHASKASKGAHHLYQHLVLKHNKMLVADDQSEGARKVWAKAASHRKINVHGWDGEKAIHAHPSEDEHYVAATDYGKYTKDRDSSPPEERAKYNKEIVDMDKTAENVRLVMHKK